MTADTAAQTAAPAPALKEIFDAARLRAIAEADRRRLPGVRRPPLPRCCPARSRCSGADGATATHNRETCARPCPTTPAALAILERLAPRLDHRFVSLILPDYVALYGLDDPARSLDALRFFTTFGSAEFAIRPFLRRDLTGTLATMERWARDEDEHVRRLASEGSRPRLPWSFRLDALVADPSPTAPILDALNADPSLYVRKSVANHLNDITKDHRTGSSIVSRVGRSTCRTPPGSLATPSAP